VYLYVHGERTEQAEAVRARDPLWAAPLLWRSELRNTLVGLVRRRAIPLEDAIEIANDVERWMAGREYAVISHHVLRLSVHSGCSAYDCEFVALAQDLDTPLVTTERALLKAFPAVALTPELFAR
jgi:predicted nucleic acid-binding protein